LEAMKTSLQKSVEEAKASHEEIKASEKLARESTRVAKAELDAHEKKLLAAGGELDGVLGDLDRDTFAEEMVQAELKSKMGEEQFLNLGKHVPGNLVTGVWTQGEEDVTVWLRIDSTLELTSNHIDVSFSKDELAVQMNCER